MEEINLGSIEDAVNPFTDHHNENKRENRKSINKAPVELLWRDVSRESVTRPLATRCSSKQANIYIYTLVLA